MSRVARLALQCSTIVARAEARPSRVSAPWSPFSQRRTYSGRRRTGSFDSALQRLFTNLNSLNGMTHSVRKHVSREDRHERDRLAERVGISLMPGGRAIRTVRR